MNDRSTYAWPPNWQGDPTYQQLYATLVAQHGDERTGRIIRGIDKPTNKDLAKWRGLGRK